MIPIPVANYRTLRPRGKHHLDYWQEEIYFLAMLSRATLRLCERERIIGSRLNEWQCRFVLRRIRRLADFKKLDAPEGYIADIRTAQVRIEGMGINA